MLMNRTFISSKSSLLAVAGMSLGLVSNAYAVAEQRSWYRPVAEQGTVLPNAPGWLSRTDFQVTFKERHKDIWEVITIQPLWQPKQTQHTFFFQGRYGHQNSDDVLTGGGGYRYRTDNGNHIFGINTFYDHTSYFHHSRYTVGGEYFNRWVTFRVNVFQRISDKRYKKIGNDSIRREAAASGYNVSLDVPMPHMPWIRAVVSYSKWRLFAVTDSHGWQAHGDFDVTDNLQLKIGGITDHGSNKARMFLKVNVLLGRNPENDYTSMSHFITKSFWNDRNLADHMLDKVQRSEKALIERETAYFQDMPPMTLMGAGGDDDPGGFCESEYCLM